MLIEGETPATMAKSTGLGLLELPTVFERLQPDVVITVGDRFETMATALAATYMNIPLAHTMGGEVVGQHRRVDPPRGDEVRARALPRVHGRGGADRQARRGAGDRARRRLPAHGSRRRGARDRTATASRSSSRDGVGGTFDLDEPFVIVSQHPVTTEYGDGERQIAPTLEAVQQLGLPAIVLWPNADAGSEDVARGIRKFREHEDDARLHFFKNLPTTTTSS